MINIICIGNVKEKELINLNQEYLKRISKFTKITITELSEEKFSKSLSSTEILNIQNLESNKILNKIDTLSNPFVISLDLSGQAITSEELASKISEINTYTSSNIVFIIGGSLGLSRELVKKSNLVLSFSSLTFPHQLIRLFLLEQIFRSYKINNNETYHH